VTGLDPAVRNYLVVRRLAIGLNQRDLAVLLGTSQGPVSEMENGLRDVRFSTLTRWAAALGVRPVVGWELLPEDES